MASEHLSVSLSQQLKIVENENSYPPLHQLRGKLPLRERNSNLYPWPDTKRDRSRSPVQKKNVKAEQRNDCLRRDHRLNDESAQYRVNATRHTNEDMNHKDLYHQTDNLTDPFDCFGIKVLMGGKKTEKQNHWLIAA
ncbi:hypothetical protein CEXT_815191 [Caerostris extrusa]|uniref:Uncharacterized protein n=1 Tax=Caerostris extrusa TaxID=172846 RepID=A0AAV4UEX7_CAEEX|nr:hypothetical protein CEXT_815191 [Caerostris extrusa]